MDRIYAAPNRTANSAIYGSLAYLLAGTDYHTATNTGGIKVLAHIGNTDGWIVKDFVVATLTTNMPTSYQGFYYLNCTGGGVACGSGTQTITNATYINQGGGTTTNTFGSQWVQTNVHSGTRASIYSTGNMFQPELPRVGRCVISISTRFCKTA